MKLVISALADVAEGLRDQYEQRGNAFHLKVEDPASAASHPAFAELQTRAVEAANKVAEFRDSNIALNKKLKEINEALGDLAPSDVPALKAKLAEAEGKLKTKPNEFKSELEAALKPLQDEIGNLKATNARIEQEKRDSKLALSRKSLENALSTAGVKAGVDERAIDDFVQRGMKVFTLDEEGNPVPKNGSATIYSKTRAGEVLSIEEWAGGPAKESAPHLFKPSTGGGADPAGTKAGAGPAKVIPDNAFMDNLEAIASGKARLSA